MDPIKRSAQEDKCRPNRYDSNTVQPQLGFDEQLSSGTSNYLQEWRKGHAKTENQKAISDYAVGVRKSSAILIF